MNRKAEVNSSEPTPKRQCTSQNKIVYCTKSEVLAKSLDYNIKIKCSDNTIAYTTWGFLSGVEYFNNIVNSGMKESTTRELHFEYLNFEDTEKYIELIIQSTINGSIMGDISTINLYRFYAQADFHNITFVMSYLAMKLIDLPWSIQFYCFMIKYNILPMKGIVSKYVNSFVDETKGNIEWKNEIEIPPETESTFWNHLITDCNSVSISAAWIVCYRFLPIDKLKEIIVNNTSKPDLSNVSKLMKCPQKDKEKEILVVISWAIDRIMIRTSTSSTTSKSSRKNAN